MLRAKRCNLIRPIIGLIYSESLLLFFSIRHFLLIFTSGLVAEVAELCLGWDLFPVAIDVFSFLKSVARPIGTCASQTVRFGAL